MWNKIKSLFSKSKAPPNQEPDNFMVVWGVTVGPMSDGEGEEEVWFVVAKASIGEEVFFTNIFFDTFTEAYEFDKHFKVNFDPLTIRIGGFDD